MKTEMTPTARDRLAEIKTGLSRGAYTENVPAQRAIGWLVAELERLRLVESDFSQLSDLVGRHHGEEQIALARAEQAEADLRAWRTRFRALVDGDSPDSAGNAVITLKSDLAILRQRHDRLREAFARYARHDDDCGPWDSACRCGYAAKAVLEGDHVRR